MNNSKVKIKIITPNNHKVSRTISGHSDIDDLKNQIDLFIKETNEAITAGKQLSVTCSKCCNNISFSNCLKIKTKVKTGDNNLSM